MITPHCIHSCLSLQHLSQSVADSLSHLSDPSFNFICRAFGRLLPAYNARLSAIPAGVSCSVLGDGILRVGATLRRCWRRGMAERIIPDDRSIKCVAVRCRPGLMLSCLLWFSTSSEALPFFKPRLGARGAESAVPFIKG